MWDNISDEARDLVKKMLEHDQNVRVTAREALQHPWLKVSSTIGAILEPISRNVKFLLR